MNEAFHIFLEEKRIDAQALKKARLEVYEAWEKEFQEVGPQVFDQNKKFFFNPFRIDFPYKTHTPREKSKPSLGKKRPKPVIKPKISASGTSTDTKKKPPLRKPVMKKSGDQGGKGVPSPTKKKPIMKRPIMKKSTDEGEKKEGPKKPIMKRPIMKKPTDEGEMKEGPKKPIMKKRTDEGKRKEGPKKPIMKRPIMKPVKPKKKEDTPD